MVFPPPSTSLRRTVQRATHDARRRLIPLGSGWKLAQRFQISEIFMPSRSALGLNQRRSPEKWNQGAANRMLDAIAPCGLEVRDSTDRGQNIDSMRRQPELNHDIRSPQVIERNPEIVERCAKFGKRNPNTVGVVLISIDPDVDVLRGARYPVCLLYTSPSPRD